MKKCHCGTLITHQTTCAPLTYTVMAELSVIPQKQQSSSFMFLGISQLHIVTLLNIKKTKQKKALSGGFLLYVRIGLQPQLVHLF